MIESAKIIYVSTICIRVLKGGINMLKPLRDYVVLEKAKEEEKTRKNLERVLLWL